MDTYNTEGTNKSLKKLLKEVNELKLACQEEVRFIKAQTVSKENSEKLMNEAKERLVALSKRLGEIKPYIAKYEGSLSKLNSKLRK